MPWTRTSDRWKSKPGSFDDLNLSQPFPSSNKYGIPDLHLHTEDEIPEPPSCLLPYNIRVRSEKGYEDSAMSFFVDDYRFSFVWNNPTSSFQRIEKANIALTPDFSLYADFPLSAQIWNTYRNRWCGAYWQSKGVTVIPTISWSTPESYEFCFEGVKKSSPVAISTQGMKWDIETYKRFEHGFREMMRRINPRFIICYGKMDERLKAQFPDTLIKEYPTYWQGLREARKNGKQEEFYRGIIT